ncbi:hypothetical protein J6590_086350 [Homalodisca vitripennis]|nr:hypothetical protein J6590_086350 [Homalodisca vitripennis]
MKTGNKRDKTITKRLSQQSHVTRTTHYRVCTADLSYLILLLESVVNMKWLLVHVFVADILLSHLTSADLDTDLPSTDDSPDVEVAYFMISARVIPCASPSEYRDSRGRCRKLRIRILLLAIVTIGLVITSRSVSACFQTS